MDENETIEAPVGGGLAQVAPQAIPAPAPAPAPATPQPSEYQKAIAELQRQRQEVIAQGKRLADSLEARIAGPQQMMFALAAGFGKPTRTGSFGESLGYATEALGQHYNQQRQQMSDIAKMRLELQMQELGMREKDVELARNQDLQKALDQVINRGQQPGIAGAPAGAPAGGMTIPPSVAPILNVMKVMNPEAAIKYIADLAKDDAKRPDAIKAMETYLSMLPPEMLDQARAYVARTNIFGKPEDKVAAEKAFREMGAEQQISPAEVEARINQLYGRTPSAAPAPQIAPTRIEPVAPVGSALPVAQAPARPATGQQQFVPKTKSQIRIEEEAALAPVKAAGAALTQEAQEEAKRVSAAANSANTAFSNINSMGKILNLSPNAPQGALQPLITNVQNLFSSFGFKIDDLNNAQVVDATINKILKDVMGELGARGLTNTDMETIRASLPRLNTSKEARDAVANILIKSYNKDIENFRIARVNQARVSPEIASRKETPLFYIQWLESAGLTAELKNRYKNADQFGKDNLIQSFNRKFGLGTAEDILGIQR